MAQCSMTRLRDEGESFEVLDSDCLRATRLTAMWERIDFIASNQIYPKLMQRETTRAREGDSEHIDRFSVKTASNRSLAVRRAAA